MAKPTPAFYIFHGEDSLGVETAVDKIRRESDEFNTTEFDGQSASVPEVMNAVTSYPFLADKRVALVSGMLSWLTRKGAGETGKRGIEQLLDELPKLPDFARLVFYERGALAENNKLVQLAGSAPNGYIKNFAVPKDLAAWLTQRAQSEYNALLQPSAAFALAAVIGDDLRRADNELFKLVCYVLPGQPITEPDVAALTPYVAEANIFKMTDALAEGNGKAALQLLHRLLQEKDNDPFSLFGMIIRQFRLLLLAKEHLTTGGGAGNLAAVLKVQPFAAQTFARQSRAFSVVQLEHIYRTLGDYDFKMKTGQLKPELALDLLVAGLAG
ncbi:MAG: DNA polymerase III subunit delta [Armatimonadetes bacterium]|nr:DNA polymerase III subunit delta [Anaerolineae bacterium]